ncbi:DUF2807 domain-containing protein [Arenibacter sp. GZD96]|uniref:GIN domain-containing protein n=1 Tax=Aurantibrevibacter litoralis TaxID=3106030 RepID=UPI002AFFAA43|nr:DUF2807 domain-containing protein [Arenibacter sp. GZD-96]MEA1784591.1 DUF2807 domain-containing protein [Arenibacter sp. GZD-96]
MLLRGIVVLFFLIACIPVIGQRTPTIKGNRNVVTINENLPPFHTIELQSNLDIYIAESAAHGYSLIADENLVDILKFSVEDGVLVISSYYKIKSKKKLEITIHYEALDAIRLHDGRLETKTQLKAYEQLEVHTFGFSKIELQAKGSIINIRMADSSSGNFNVACDSLNFEAKDRVRASYYGNTDNQVVRLHRNAKVDAEGTTNQLEALLYENSEFKATTLQSSAVSASLNDSATLSVWATDSLMLSSKGSARTFLYGDPKIEIREFLDTSQLIKKK